MKEKDKGGDLAAKLLKDLKDQRPRLRAEMGPHVPGNAEWQHALDAVRESRDTSGLVFLLLDKAVKLPEGEIVGELRDAIATLLETIRPNKRTSRLRYIGRDRLLNEYDLLVTFRAVAPLLGVGRLTKTNAVKILAARFHLSEPQIRTLINKHRRNDVWRRDIEAA